MGLSADDRRATRFLPDDAGAAPPVGPDLAPAWPTRNGGAARAARPRDRDRREAPAGGTQQKVTREKTHSRASPLPPCAASILTLRGIALRLLADSGAITKYFTQHASPPRRRDHSITSS